MQYISKLLKMKGANKHGGMAYHCKYAYMSNEEFGQELALHIMLSKKMVKCLADRRLFKYRATGQLIMELNSKDPVIYDNLIPLIHDALQDLDPIFMKSFFTDDQLSNNPCRLKFYKHLMNDPQMTRMFNYPAIEHDFRICYEDVLLKYVNWIVYLATSPDAVDKKYVHLYAKDSALMIHYAIDRKFDRLLYRLLEPRKEMVVLPNLEHIYPLIAGRSVSYHVIDLFVRYDPMYVGQHLPKFVLNAYLQYAKKHGEDFTQILADKFGLGDAENAVNLAEGFDDQIVPGVGEYEAEGAAPFEILYHEEAPQKQIFDGDEGVPSKQMFDNYPEEGAVVAKKQSLLASVFC